MILAGWRCLLSAGRPPLTDARVQRERDTVPFAAGAGTATLFAVCAKPCVYAVSGTVISITAPDLRGQNTYACPMARYFDVHPENPQPRIISAVAASIRSGELVAYPTDSCYALGCRLGNRDGIGRIRSIRNLDERHHFTLVCQNFAQLGQFVQIDNDVFRAIKAATPGRYTFILPATKEVPRQLLHPRKKTVGVRIPDHVVTQALLAELGEPLASSTLLLPDEGEPMTQGWEIKERLDHVVDAVVDSGECGTEPTTVVDFSDGDREILRRGAGDPTRFE
jgi:tRNA threonylcarbamoyl adenosine modification protein (Sua5/YciO/YrdC/YwlC family)